MSDADPLATRRKRLLYQSQHRGLKEADILIGRFAAMALPTMSLAQLERFERLLDEQDADILDWVIGRQPVPAEHRTDVFNLLQKFKLS